MMLLKSWRSHQLLIATWCSFGALELSAWELGPFEKIEAENPCLHTRPQTPFLCPLQRRTVFWEAKDVFNPSAVVRNGKVHLLYRAEDHDGNLAGTSRIGLAVSTDGVHFPDERRFSDPVLYPDRDRNEKIEWQGGIEDPRVVESEDGLYVMTYTAYNGVARLCVATSRDLISWTKHGPVFAAAHGGAFMDAWTKSGSIVSTLVGGKLLATKINGQYWMYWGENSIYAAVSDDLISWTPLLSDTGPEYRGRPDQASSALKGIRPLVVFSPRRGFFDSDLVEPGPPAILTPRGIVFIYNSKNKWCMNTRNGSCRNGESDSTIAPGTYSAGQVLLDKADPSKVLNRTSHSFLAPTMAYEKTGQVANVVFLEGLVLLNGELLLYYGTADSKIAVARAPSTSMTTMSAQRGRPEEVEVDKEALSPTKPYSQKPPPVNLETTTSFPFRPISSPISLSLFSIDWLGRRAQFVSITCLMLFVGVLWARLKKSSRNQITIPIHLPCFKQEKHLDHEL